jgi:CheY-like chemotaxis protein
MMDLVSDRQGSSAAGAARLLVVEDERIVAMSLQGKLQSMGYRVAALTASGEEAVALAEQLRPDLVLMDISLDGAMDGVEAARIIRGRLKIPVVYLTAYSNRDVVERAKVTEPFGYVLKPFVDRELQIVIEMALYRHQMERKILEQQRLLAATLRSIGDAVVATDSAGRITFLNPIAEQLTGWQHQEALGRSMHEVLSFESEKDRQRLDSPLDRALRDKVLVPLANHTSLVARDQRRVPIDDTAAPSWTRAVYFSAASSSSMT